MKDFAHRILVEKGEDSKFITDNGDGTFTIRKGGREVPIDSFGVEIIDKPLGLFYGESSGMDINAIYVPNRKAEYTNLAKGKTEFLFHEYTRKGNVGLHHKGFGEAEVTINTMGHFRYSGMSPEKISVCCDRHALNAIFRAGTARQERVVFVDKKQYKKGKYQIDNNKLNWLECWHVTGKATINGIRVGYDFTVIKRFDDRQFEVYNLEMTRQ